MSPWLVLGGQPPPPNPVVVPSSASATFVLARRWGVIKPTGDNTVEGNSVGTILGGSLTTLTKQ